MSDGLLRPEIDLEKVRDAALVAFLTYAAVVNVLAFRGYHFEDAYITFRYAANLAAGQGFVFNPGERVLGTSTPLYTLLLAALASLGLDVVACAGALYGLGLSLCGYAGFRLLRRAGYPNAGVVFALLAVWGPGGTLHFFGMETALYLALVFLALLAAWGRRPWTTGLILGLVATTRYDGVLVAGVVLLWRWIRSAPGGEPRRRIPWREAVVCGAVLGSWLLFARLYFGDPLPNTLAAKTGTETFFGYLGGALERQYGFLFSPLHRFWGLRELPAFLRPLIAVLLPLPAVLGAPRLLPRLWPLPAIALLLTLGYAVIGPPAGHRWYLTPGLYALLAFCLAGWGDLLRARRPAGAASAPRRAAAAVLALIVGSAAALPAGARREAASLIDSPAHATRVAAYDQLIVWMRDHGLDRATLLTNEPGYLTYHTGQPAIDGAGLVTRGVFLHAAEKRTPLERLAAEYRPELIVLPTELGLLDPAVRGSYLPIFQAQPFKLLLIRRSTYESYLDRLHARWLEDRFYYPGPPPELGHPIAFDFESNPTPGWNHDLLNRFFVGRPLWQIRFAGRPVKDRYLQTYGNRPDKVASLWSDPFRIDFDELSFRFAGSHPRYTVAQLYAGGLPVLEVGGAGTETPIEMQQVVMPVYPWRGQVGVLRFVDADRGGGFLVADRVTSRRYARADVLDDFESGAYGELWQQGFGERPTPTLDLARRYGLQVAQGRYAASSLGRPGRQALVSRPFVLSGDHLGFAVLDFGGPETSVNLWVGGEKVRRFVGRRTERLEMVRWSVAPWRGQEAILRVVDWGRDPERGIAVDSFLLFD